MLFNKKDNANEMSLVIHATRSSVCMGDDCMAPNPEDLGYEPGEMMSDLVPRIAKYVPNMKDSWWDIYGGDKLMATIYFDSRGKARYKMQGPDVDLADIPDGEIFCRYNY